MWSFVRACTCYVTFPRSAVLIPGVAEGPAVLVCMGIVCEDCTLEGVSQNCSSASCPKKWALQGASTWIVPWHSHLSLCWYPGNSLYSFAKCFQSGFKNHFESHKKIMENSLMITLDLGRGCVCLLLPHLRCSPHLHTHRGWLWVQLHLQQTQFLSVPRQVVSVVPESLPWTARCERASWALSVS